MISREQKKYFRNMVIWSVRNDPCGVFTHILKDCFVLGLDCPNASDIILKDVVKSVAICQRKGTKHNSWEVVYLGGPFY